MTAKAFVFFEEIFTPIMVSLLFTSEIIPESVKLSWEKLVINENKKVNKKKLFFAIMVFVFSILTVTDLTN